VNTPKKVRVIKKSSSNEEEMKGRENARWIVAMGGGEGGYNAYLKIIPHLPGKLPFAILAVQYTKEEYLQSFCDYLNRTSRIVVKKAQQGELIKEGVCYFTHNGNYLKIEQSPEGPCCQITPTPVVISQQNVVNQLFFSVSEKYGANSMGVLLTGSGVDGIEGLQELKRVRAMTIVQDPKTCLVPQSVRTALEAKCVDHMVMDVDIAAMIWHLLKNKQNL
jgi:two-component system chemotaxis response regulator CheB